MHFDRFSVFQYPVASSGQHWIEEALKNEQWKRMNAKSLNIYKNNNNRYTMR